MSRFKAGLKNAFAVDPPGAAEPTESQRVVIDRVCKEVARRHLTTPALMFMEMSRPLNYVGAQVMHFFEPIVSVVVDTEGYQQFAAFLERRGSVEYLCRRIEHFESDIASDATRQAEAATDVKSEGDR